MRITFVLPTFARKPIGGVRVVYEYANRLATLGCEVTVVHERWRQGWAQPVVHVREAWRDIWNSLRPNRLRTAMKWFPVDNRVRLAILPVLEARRLPPGDVVVATHWTTARLLPHLSPGHGKPVHLVQGYEVWDGTDEVHAVLTLDVPKIVVSSYRAGVLRRLGVGEERITVVPNGLDLGTFRPPDADRPRGRTVALLADRHPVKGLKTGVAALTAARRVLPDLTVHAFGVGERPDELPQWMTYHQGLSGNSLVEQVYRRSAVYLCSSTTEGWGFPAAEAMACGSAVVSTRNGGVEDFCVHAETALLAEVGDRAGLAEAGVKMLVDEDFRAKCVEAGFRAVSRMDWATSANSFYGAMQKA